MTEVYVETKRHRGAGASPTSAASEDESLATTPRDATRALVAAYPAAAFVALLGAGYLLGRILARR
jgi:hypothetical protein